MTLKRIAIPDAINALLNWPMAGRMQGFPGYQQAEGNEWCNPAQAQHSQHYRNK